MPPSKSDEKTKKGGKTAAGKGKDLVDGRKLATRELRKRRQEQSKSQIAGLNAIAEKEDKKKLSIKVLQRQQQAKEQPSTFQHDTPALAPATVATSG